MKFPLVTSRSQFDDILKNKREIKLKTEQIGNYKFDIISYMVAIENTFDSDLSRECRGIMFDHITGELISRPFHKFFNVNEKESTKIENIGKINAITNKLDGSLAIPVLIGNKIIWKTKKSFYSDIAVQINKFYNNNCTKTDIYDLDILNNPVNQELHDMILNILSNDHTPLFEYIGPNNRIVLKYDHESLKLLATRNNYDGTYILSTKNYNNELVLLSDVNDIIKKIINQTNIEGVIVSDDKDFYKIKTSWYVIRHRAISYISKKMIIDKIIDQELDDIYSILIELKLNEKLEKIKDLEKEINNYILDIEDQSDKLLVEFAHKSDKDLAISISDHRMLLFIVMKKRNCKPYIDKFRLMLKRFFKNKYKTEVI